MFECHKPLKHKLHRVLSLSRLQSKQSCLIEIIERLGQERDEHLIQQSIVLLKTHRNSLTSVIKNTTKLPIQS